MAEGLSMKTKKKPGLFYFFDPWRWSFGIWRSESTGFWWFHIGFPLLSFGICWPKRKSFAEILQEPLYWEPPSPGS
jgi:hypothetical protein